MEFELDLEGETRYGEKEAQPGGIQRLLGEDPKAGRSLLAEGGRQGRTAREDWKSQPGSVWEGSKSQAEELDSTLPVDLAVGDYWKFLSKGVIVESLVWGRNR